MIKSLIKLAFPVVTYKLPVSNAGAAFSTPEAINKSLIQLHNKQVGLLDTKSTIAGNTAAMAKLNKEYAARMNTMEVLKKGLGRGIIRMNPSVNKGGTMDRMLKAHELSHYKDYKSKKFIQRNWLKPSLKGMFATGLSEAKAYSAGYKQMKGLASADKFRYLSRAAPNIAKSMRNAYAGYKGLGFLKLLRKFR